MDRKLYYSKIFLLAFAMLFIFSPIISSAQTTVESTSPVHGEEDVGLEPTIKIKFLHNLSTTDFTDFIGNSNEENNKIHLKFGVLNGEYIDLDYSNTEISISVDKKTLLIELKDNETNVNGLLRANTPYTFIIDEGCIEFDIDGDENLVNEEIVLNFTTGSSGESPKVIAYSSRSSLTDDITDLDSTNLDSSESIYIGFDRAIKFDKDFKSGVKIVTNEEEIKDFFELENCLNSQNAPIKSVEILKYKNDYRVLKITPKYSLDNLNKYNLSIDKGAIENSSGYNLDKDIDFSFWTEKSNEALDASWESVEGYQVDEFQEDTPYFELPKYGKYTSIYIDTKGEVIPKAQEEIFKSLEDIKIADYYNYTDSGEMSYIGIHRIDEIPNKIFSKDGSRIYIYPSEELKYGRRYKLEIPRGTFESMSGKDLPKLEFDFVVKSDSSQPMDVLRLENNENDIETISKATWEILVRGYNFRQNIRRAVIRDSNTGIEANIESEDVEFEDVTTIKLKIRDESKTEFLEKFGSINDETKLNIIIDFKDADETKDININGGLTITPKDGPDSSEKDPSDMDIWYDENEINKKKIDGEYIYFLKVTFDDTDIDGDGDGDIDIKHTKSSDGTKNYTGLETLREWSSIKASGSSVSFVNIDFIRKVIKVLEDEEASESKKNRYLEYIFEKNEDKEEAYLYVPIKLLNSQTTYNVNIASDVVVYSGSGEGNETIRWSFTTMANPVTTDVLIGSVAEDYDEDKPIIIKGQYFYDDVEVYFNDIEAEKVKIKEAEDGDTYLEVYLPDGGDRLEPGIYNIYIENDDNHVRELYGAFSVVKEGEWIPNEEYISSEVDLGEVRADIKVSENTVVLESKYADDRYLELDLDELMGSETLVRKISIDGDNSDKIGILKTKSKWADIDFYNVGLDSGSDNDEIILTLGRADQALKEALQKKLAGSSIKSEFIRATGKNCVLDSIILGIPFEKSNGKNLKVLRYDEDTRNFYMEKMSINQVDKIVTVQSQATGVFVIIED